MDRYWDLSKRQRSELTSEQIESYLTIELMERGVIVPAEPKYATIEDLPEPDVVVYGIKGRYSNAGFGFDNANDAAAFCLNAKVIESHYNNGEYQYTLSKEAPEVEALRMYSEETYARNKGMIERNTAAKKANEELKTAYNKQREAVERATSSIWDDAYECQSLAHKYKQIIDTFNEYLGHCDGEKKQAFFFLGKAYEAPEIFEAFEWFEMERPDLEVECVSVASTESDEVPA